MKFIQTKGHSFIVIRQEGEETACAQFDTFAVGGEAAYNAFRNGLAHSGNIALYDADAGQYLIGTMAQLMEGR